MDWGHLFQYAFYTVVALAAAVWAIHLIRWWVPSAERRGGLWYLEAILLIAGPICITTAALAQGPDGLVYGPFEVVNRFARYIAIGLSMVAVVAGLRNPRRRIGGLATALALFYAALVLSAIAGAEPGLPEAYYLTPLVLFAFLIPGNYSYEWLLKIGRLSLRVILLITVASAAFLPELAFRLDGTRQAFGISQLQGLTGHPNTLAAIAVLGLLLEIGSRSKWPWRLLSAAAVIGAQSSTGYIAAVVGVLFLNTKGSKASRRLLIAAALVILGFFMFAPHEVEAIISTVMPPTAQTLTGRTGIWSASMMGFESHPVFGYGPTLLNEDFRGMYLPGFDAAAQAHNQLVQTLAGTGIVGTVTLAILTLSLTVHTGRGFKPSRGITWGLLAFLVIRCVTETPLRPTGIGFESFVLIIVIGLIATASASRGVTKSAEDEAVSKPVVRQPSVLIRR